MVPRRGSLQEGKNGELPRGLRRDPPQHLRLPVLVEPFFTICAEEIGFRLLSTAAGGRQCRKIEIILSGVQRCWHEMAFAERSLLQAKPTSAGRSIIHYRVVSIAP